ncbi:MAG: DNA damage-inducible protein DinB [Ignavibacteriales bacterium CG_4_9_14_3_um_filter_30_11]|nr:MAG: DNA damage-inducible protein DinB [Ignavibacteriales bacterium CG_4_9_14_3_um_filter_30_11]
MSRPSKNDYAEYYHKYIQEIDGDNIFEVLEKQLNATLNLFKNISEDKGNYSYAAGKWSIKEVIGHCIDTERIFAYRALCIARGEKKSLPGMEQDDYAKKGEFNRRTLKNLLNEYELVRKSNIILFNSFQEKVLQNRGIASDNEVTVLGLMFIIAGHELHHIKVIKEKYLKS